MERRNAVLVIAGPSAVGKTAIAKAIVERDPRFTFLRSGTTRKRRGDANDDEYLYYSEGEFFAAVLRGEFAEYMRYGGNLYGTPKSELKRAIDMGKIPLMVLDLTGVESLAKLEDFCACSVYIHSPIGDIEGRLAERYLGENKTPDTEELYKLRCEQNRRDYGAIGTYADHIFAFIENVTTIEACRDRVMAEFSDFCRGKDFPTEENRRIACSLKGSIK